jgi:hypothetical protein
MQQSTFTYRATKQQITYVEDIWPPHMAEFYIIYGHLDFPATVFGQKIFLFHHLFFCEVKIEIFRHKNGK